MTTLKRPRYSISYKESAIILHEKSQGHCHPEPLAEIRSPRHHLRGKRNAEYNRQQQERQDTTTHQSRRTGLMKINERTNDMKAIQPEPHPRCTHVSSRQASSHAKNRSPHSIVNTTQKHTVSPEAHRSQRLINEHAQRQ